MMASHYDKGSEWRRWDLHIHTPGTQKNDQFDGKGPIQKWEKYIEDINNYAHEIAAIGITDYLSIDNYFKFKEFISNGRITKAIPLVLPNVELRMVPVTSSSVPINLHCIFNPQFDEKIAERFLNKLQFDNGKRKITASRHDLIYLGREHSGNSLLPEDKALKDGINLFVVSIENLKKIFDEDPELRANTFIIVSNKSSDGASGLKDHADFIEGVRYESLDATRRTIYRFADGLFSGMPKDIKYFLGEGIDSITEVKRKCFSLKPCFHGSDAHENKKIFEPDLKRYCWLKANPTFTGLKQTLYEPGTRVRIQEEIPEQKRPYLVVDSVKFVTTGPERLFFDGSIELNDKLNAIIGGKSSGKSLLLYYIAKTIDPGQVEKKYSDLDLESGYDFDQSPGFDFLVTWKDGMVNSLTEPAIDKKRQITYIPQMYINYLAEKRGKEGLKQLIQSFLEEQESFIRFLNNANKEKDEIKNALASSISQFFVFTEQQRKTNELIKTKGDKAARLKNLNDKEHELANLRTVAGFSKADEQAFGRLDTEKKRLAGRLTTLQALLDTFQGTYPAELRRVVKQTEDSFDAFSRINRTKFPLHTVAGTSLTAHIDMDKTEVGVLFRKLIDRSLQKANRIGSLINALKDRIEACDFNLQPYLNKVKNRVKLEKLQGEIKAEQLIIDQILELERESANLTKVRREEFDHAKGFYAALMEIYKKIVIEINSNSSYSDISPEKKIKLKAFIDFDVERFNATCTNFINKQSYFSATFGNYFNDANQYQFQQDQHLQNFSEMFVKIQNSTKFNIRFNQGGTAEIITRGLLDDYFSVSFELSQDGEDILKMSPGKKGLILLLLILHLSHADYPILIDQPEDNLDNRTVYTELKDFMKTKKIQRQIIIVTHNANLAVTTDAENIIVSNQDGQAYGKENGLYRFEYQTGALENSYRNEVAPGILQSMGIKEHVCEILEGGEAAFIEREKRYGLSEF